MAIYDVFAAIVEKYGEPQHAVKMTRQQAGQYRGRVPEALMTFWEKHGMGSYKKGRSWICDPEFMKPVADKIFGNDPEYSSSDVCVIGYEASGNLLCWHKSREDIYVEVRSWNVRGRDPITEAGWIPLPGFPPPDFNRPPPPEDFSVGIAMETMIENEEQLLSDDDAEDIFNQACQFAGFLEPGEIYGFVPALGFGGMARVENIRRVGVVEHLLFLAQLGPFYRTILTPPQPGWPFGKVERVRQIGKSTL